MGDGKGDEGDTRPAPTVLGQHPVEGGARQDPAHEREHAIEVQLPFLRRLRPDLAFVPITLMGDDLEFCEAVGDAVFGWCREGLGVTVNEMFGQTEINYIVGNCTRSLDGRGRVAPGWPALPGWLVALSLMIPSAAAPRPWGATPPPRCSPA